VIHLGAVLLAAGASRRYGDRNKLLIDFDGRPMLRVVAETILDVERFRELVVVTGYDPPAIEQALGGLPVRYAHNDAWEKGMGGSIAAGIAALSEACTGAAIVPGDMPFLTAELLDRLATAFEKSGGSAVVFPATDSGEQRNPVVWPRRFFGPLGRLQGREGGKSLLADAAASWIAVPVADDGELDDIDEPLPRGRSVRSG
jgi:molybdenum cofactor cytidylyltransferase